MKQLVLFVLLLILSVAAQAQNEKVIRFHIQNGTETVSIIHGQCTIEIAPQDVSIYATADWFGKRYGTSILFRGGEKSWNTQRIESNGRLGYAQSDEIVSSGIVGKTCRNAWDDLPSGLRSRLDWHIGKELELTERHQAMNAVTLYNAYTLWLLRDPADGMKESRALSSTVTDSPAENDIKIMLPRYRGSNKLTDESWHQIDTFVSVNIAGTTATIRTMESAYWKSESRVRYNPTGVSHTYTLQKVGSEWKIISDKF